MFNFSKFVYIDFGAEALITVEQNKNYGSIHYFDFDLQNNGILVSNDFNSFLKNLRVFSWD
jgi:hypothetical protein